MNVVDTDRCDFRLICLTNPSMGETSWLKQLKREKLPFETIPIPHKASIKDLLAIPRRIREWGADIVHTMDHRSDVVGMVAGRLTGRPSVAWFAGWTNWTDASAKGQLYAWADRNALKRMNAIIVDSAFLARKMDLGAHAPPIVAIPNGVNLERFDPDRVAISPEIGFSRDSDSIIFGIVGRVHPNKGQLDFVRAAAELIKTYPSCRFVICGSAPAGFEDYQRQVVELIAAKGLNDVFRVMAVPASEVANVVAGIDIILAPCHTESCSFAILEGMAMRKPVVAARAGGNPDMIEDGETGTLVEPHSWQALVDGATPLIQDQALRARIGENARREIEKRYSIEAMGSRTAGFYEAVIEWHKERRRFSQPIDELKARLSGAGVLTR